jgi:ABC-type branched-subunit amino acid transport system ATPase component/ABC-type branched-subunit amino acid transport system permease subunit
MALASTYVTSNLVFQGFVNGLVIAVLAMGVVLVYRSSRVINFAVGDMGVPATALLVLIVSKYHWPFWPALAVALLVGTLTGALVELAVIRRLFKAPRVIVLVATIGVAQLMQAITYALPDFQRSALASGYPRALTGQWEPGFGITVTGPQVVILIVVPLLAFGLWFLLSHTAFGAAVRATATNADLARLTGVSPKVVSSMIWTLAGLISTISVYLIASQRNATTRLVDIGPNTLLRALAAALIGGMVSFPIAAVGAVAIGVVESLVFFNFPSESGLIEFVLFVVVLLLAARTGRRSESGGESFSFAPRAQAVPERLREARWVRALPYLLPAIALVIAIAAPIVMTQPSRQFTYSLILSFAICAVSVTVLTGWAGQLSLGQMAFAGLGALSAAAFLRGPSLDIGWHGTRILRGSLPHVSFIPAVLLGTVVASVVAVLIGLGTLRVKGLLLAVATLAFAIAAQQYVFRRPILSEGGSLTVHRPRGHLGPVNLDDLQRNYYYFVVGALILVLVLASRLRRSGIGRMVIGVRENELAAAAYTVSPARAKLVAFGVAGAIAGLGGALIGGLVETIGYQERFFRVVDSLQLVSMVVIGGLGTLAGPVIGAVWIEGLPAFWPKNQLVPLFTSSIGMLILLLYLPGGFVQIGYWVRGLVFRAVERRLPPAPAKATVEPPRSLHRAETLGPPALNADGSVLRTRGVTVTFGGNVAVSSVDVHANPGEVVGLIGTNGAGKSTLLNAIGGYVPSSGTVELLGRDVSRLDAPRRAKQGLGRTFQAATLFPELTVRETVQLALEARQATSFVGTVLFSPASTRLERRRRAEAAELIDFLGLGRYADRFVAELSTGTRRIVELAAMLAVSPRVVCLDEPTAGVAQREAEAFGPLILRIQEELDATLVVIEHDLPLILSISTRLYCMEAGQVIAEGTPAEIRNNPLVIASYLGTDERALRRSGALAP